MRSVQATSSHSCRSYLLSNTGRTPSLPRCYQPITDLSHLLILLNVRCPWSQARFRLRRRPRSILRALRARRVEISAHLACALPHSNPCEALVNSGIHLALAPLCTAWADGAGIQRLLLRPRHPAWRDGNREDIIWGSHHQVDKEAMIYVYVCG
jgi:hypothetical protein